MFKLKAITKDSIERSLKKAEHYRLLNEAGQAESICLDILEIEPTHQPALIVLLLAITDQFEESNRIKDARDILPRLQSDYQKAYYAGIICERKANSLLKTSGPDTKFMTYDWLKEAMSWYEKAEAVHASGDEDSVLRWNTCARVIMRNNLGPKKADNFELPLE